MSAGEQPQTQPDEAQAEPDEPQAEPEEVKKARALLEATHVFPCEYSVTVIAFNREAVTQAVRQAAATPPQSGAAAGPAGSEPVAYGSRPSSGGKYLSHRFEVRVQHADQVLALYARLRAVEGVVTII